MATTLKVLALREQFDHMSAHSGYDALYSHMPDNIAIDSIFCNFKKVYRRGVGRALLTAAKLINNSGFYNAQSVEAEIRLMLTSRKNSYNVLHYTYGEPYYGLAGLAGKKKKPAIVLTNHQPVSWWQEHTYLFKKHASANTVITLSAYDRDYFNAHIPGKAVCIPHGVDTGFYRPGASEKDIEKSFNVIFTGRYLRNMVTLAAVITKLSASAKNFQFDIVHIDKSQVRESFLIDIMALPNVNWHADLSDIALLALYQQADCCLLPLTDCTANNALLEAMACGLPIVSTDLPAIKTYLDDTMSMLGRKANAEDLCDALITLYDDRDLVKQMAKNARDKALNLFDWNIIAGTTSALFKSL